MGTSGERLTSLSLIIIQSILPAFRCETCTIRDSCSTKIHLDIFKVDAAQGY